MEIQRIPMVDTPSVSSLEASLLRGRNAKIVISDPEGVVTRIKGTRVVVEVDVLSTGRILGSRNNGFVGHIRLGVNRHVLVEGVVDESGQDSWIAIVRDRETSITFDPQV